MTDVFISRVKSRVSALDTNISRVSLEMGLGRQYLRDVLSGKSKSPSIDGAIRAAAVLQCSVAYLIGEIDDLKPISQQKTVVLDFEDRSGESL